MNSNKSELDSWRSLLPKPKLIRRKKLTSVYTNNCLRKNEVSCKHTQVLFITPSLNSSDCQAQCSLILNCIHQGWAFRRSQNSKFSLKTLSSKFSSPRNSVIENKVPANCSRNIVFQLICPHWSVFAPLFYDSWNARPSHVGSVKNIWNKKPIIDCSSFTSWTKNIFTDFGTNVRIDSVQPTSAS